MKYVSVICFGASFVFSFYSFHYSSKILPSISVAAVDVSGLTKEAAKEKLQNAFAFFSQNGIPLLIEGKKEIIDPRNIELVLPSNVLIEKAWEFGRSGSWHKQLIARITAPFSFRIIPGRIEFNEQKLLGELEIVLEGYEVPREDIRYEIKKGKAAILFDAKPGKFLNRENARLVILRHIAELDTSPIELTLDIDKPVVDPLSAGEAKTKAERMMEVPLTLSYKESTFTADDEKIGSWIVSNYKDNKLIPGLNKKLIGEYVAKIAEKIDVPAQNPAVKVENGKVADFVAPKEGRAILQDETIDLIIESLRTRAEGKEIMGELSLSVAVKKPKGEGSSADLGIIELIGKATTPFTGSPQNRIHNIKNGVRFLTGILVPPGEEFSTVEALGQIDNTAGYLPELVIKGDETVPEFGGGLCQVSTTLFRAVMNAGLPVLERRNHSYRVPYYEKDGEGNVIGSGLDATIYSPWPDFKFENDMKSHILVQGYVEGDKATFELYGTSDGRKSFIDGPKLLEETPPPDSVYLETDALPKGEKKKIDTAHPGGSAIAKYKIEYSDGLIAEQEFRSYYRRWPEKWLVGTATSTIAQCQNGSSEPFCGTKY